MDRYIRWNDKTKQVEWWDVKKHKWIVSTPQPDLLNEGKDKKTGMRYALLQNANGVVIQVGVDSDPLMLNSDLVFWPQVVYAPKEKAKTEIPPMPTQAAPEGFQWEFNTGKWAWVPERKPKEAVPKVQAEPLRSVVRDGGTRIADLWGYTDKDGTEHIIDINYRTMPSGYLAVEDKAGKISLQAIPKEPWAQKPPSDYEWSQDEQGQWQLQRVAPSPIEQYLGTSVEAGYQVDSYGYVDPKTGKTVVTKRTSRQEPDVPKVTQPTFDQAMTQALLSGDVDTAYALRDFRDAPGPETWATLGMQQQRLLLDVEQQAFNQQTQAQEQARQNLAQQIQIQQSPGDWWTYMNLLRGQQANAPYTGQVVVPRTWAEMGQGLQPMTGQPGLGQFPAFQPGPGSTPQVSTRPGPWGSPAGTPPQVAAAALQASGRWQLPSPEGGPPQYPGTPGIPTGVGMLPSTPTGPTVATGGGWWVKNPETSEKNYVRDAGEAEYFEALDPPWETGYDEPQVSQGGALPVVPVEPSTAAGPTPTPTSWAGQGISVEQFNQMPLPFSAKDEILKAQGQPYQVNVGTWDNPVAGNIFVPTPGFQIQAQAHSEARGLATQYYQQYPQARPQGLPVQAGQGRALGGGPVNWQGYGQALGAPVSWQLPPQGLSQAFQGQPVSQARQLASYGFPPAPSAQSWANLMPSEQPVFKSEVQRLGGYWPDYAQQMAALWPSYQKTRPFGRAPTVAGA